MNHAVELIASALSLDTAPRPEGDVTRGVCCVTGVETECLPRKLVMDKGFTGQALLRAPLSPWLSVAAARVLRYRPERSSSWWCNGQAFVALRRPDVRRLVIDEPPTAARWAGYVTTSYKKHGSLTTPVNTVSRAVWMFEQIPADCSDRAWVNDAWARLRAMQDAGWPRPVLEDLRPSAWLLGKLGWPPWRDFEAWARPHVEGGRYRLLCYLLPSKEELALASEPEPEPKQQELLA